MNFNLINEIKALLKGKIVKRLAGLIVAIFLGFAFLAVTGAEKPSPRVIEAEKFVLRDEAGKKRGVFEMTHNGPSLILYDNNETEQIVLLAADNGRAAISLLDRKGKPCLTVFTSNNDNTSGISLTDANGKPRLSLSGINDRYGLLLFDDKGQSRLNLYGIDRKYGLLLLDESGQPECSIPARQTNTKKETSDNERPTSDEMVAKEFECKNIHFKDSYGGVDAIGEVVNNSGKSYSMATFNMSVYNKTGNLLGVTTVLVSNFKNGQTKSFDARFNDIDFKLISKYKLDFDFGM